MILANRDHPLRLAGTGQIVLTRAKSRCSAGASPTRDPREGVTKFMGNINRHWATRPALTVT